MNHRRAGPRRRCTQLAVAVTAFALLLSACVAHRSTPGAVEQRLTVMTRNLYLGTGLTDLLRAGSFPGLATAAGSDWATVQVTDFPARAGALADEIARARPDVVALQEVTLWREQVPGDLPGHTAPDATQVVLDLLAVLQHALAVRGLPYSAVATSTNADLEVPRRGPTGLVDLRITDRDVLLARTDEAERFGNPRTGHYGVVLRLPLVTGAVENTRGWVAVDYRPDGDTTVRIIATHLEVSSGGGGPIQERQADELLALVAASPYPVLVLGDFNAPAGNSATYARLAGVLHDAWARARPADPGPTCCQAELLDNPIGRENRRIDLVLSSENWPVDRVDRTGVQPFRSSPPLWASDHFGVTARFTLN